MHQHIQLSVEESLQGGTRALQDISGLKLSLPEAQLGQGRCSTTKSCMHRLSEGNLLLFLHPPQYKMATVPITQNGNTVVLILAFIFLPTCARLQASVFMVVLLLYIEDLALCLTARNRSPYNSQQPLLIAASSHLLTSRYLRPCCTSPLTM